MQSFAQSFLLVPDRFAARRLRRDLAEEKLGFSIRAGTWTELLELVLREMPSLRTGTDWYALFNKALEETKGFWSESLKVAPEETRGEMERVILGLITTADPASMKTILPNDAGFSKRLKERLCDFQSLLNHLENRLPEELNLIRECLSRSDNVRFPRIQVLHVEGWPAVNRWQASLIGAINRGQGTKRDESLKAWLTKHATLPGSNAKTALAQVQQRIFLEEKKSFPLDASLQWLGVRDYLEEIEVSAGMIQERMQRDKKLQFRDFALLVPEDPDYLTALQTTFSRASLPLSGMPGVQSHRDLGREAILYFLTCQPKPAPAMALASLVTSPLMPWNQETGKRLAREIMNGIYSLSLSERVSQRQQEMMELIRAFHNTPAKLTQALERFGKILSRRKDLEGHRASALKTIADVTSVLREMPTDSDMQRLKSLCSPTMLPENQEGKFFLEGVTVLTSQHEPWRGCQHLMVLGFESGRFPERPGPSSVFTEDEITELNGHTPDAIPTALERQKSNRLLLQRQLSAARQSINFMIPRRNAMGDPLSPSDALIFMSRLFNEAGKDAESLILDLDRSTHRQAAQNVSLAPEETPTPPRTLPVADPELHVNLLNIGIGDSQKVRPFSPSRLETLMISPLAWLLQHSGAIPHSWQPERPDVAVRGILAHAVFEKIFAPGQKIPSQATIERDAGTIFEDILRQHAPYLNQVQWTLEKKNLGREIRDSALTWSQILKELNAKIIHKEVCLTGSWNSVTVHGKADAILRLPDNRLLVVDYKKSSSQKRRKRMEAGYDSQLELYRAMLKNGGIKNDADTNEVKELPGSDTSGLVYFMMNDKSVLADKIAGERPRIPGWHLLENNVSEESLKRIRERFKELQKGLIRLNHVEDQSFFDKTAHMDPHFVLGTSPLVALFMHTGKKQEVAP
ncbi:MAG: PD-(D/E)XK nuclease family protein [Magnetococcales bacterium]|nr:PD-(D/E)XK nuclease family protein [Magnetococcales bacterium]